MDDAKMIGKRIRDMREEHGWLQREFAKKLEVSDKTVSAWETGVAMPRMGAVSKMCSLFNCKISDITGSQWGDLIGIDRGISPNPFINGIIVEDIPTHTDENALTKDEEYIIKLYRKLASDDQDKIFNLLADLLEKKGASGGSKV